jgi:hypothetical protein
MSQSHGFTRSSFNRKAKASSARANVRFPLTAFEDLMVNKDTQYLVRGFFPCKGVAVVWGPPKCGKSFWVFDLTMHVALGRNYRGLRVKKGCIVYCALEGAQGFIKRIEAFRQNKLNGDVDPPFYLMATGLALISEHKNLIADTQAQLNGEIPAAICIDTLNRSIEGSESNDEDMTAYLRAADALREAFQCLVIIVHHCGHDGHRPRGHSSLIGGLDVQVAVKRDNNDNVVAMLELAKDGEVGLTFTSRLEQVQIGIDADGEIISSCVVEAVGDFSHSTQKNSKSRRLPPAAQIALKALHKTIHEVGEPAPASNTIPPNATVVTIEQWQARALMAGISSSETEKVKRRTFDRAQERLIADGLVGAWTNYRWLM